MNFKNALFTLLTASALLFSSCDNEIDLTAEYREIGVIYGLLDPSETVHRVRIQKAFLGDGDANQMAQITDSTYYGDILDVQIQRIQNGTVISSFPLTRYIADDKDPGYFPESPNILYKSTDQTLFRDSDYKIVVRNTQSGHEFYATTPIVDSLRIDRPIAGGNTTIQFAYPQFPYQVKFASAINGRITTLTIRFHYTEQLIGSGNPAENKYVDWVFPGIFIDDTDESHNIVINIEGEDFYEFVGESIPVNPNVIRQEGLLDFIFETGGEILANYVEINNSTSSLSTTIPYYSNVIGGTGIFSSRNMQEVKNKALDQPSKDLLNTSPHTSDLGFQ